MVRVHPGEPQPRDPRVVIRARITITAPLLAGALAFTGFTSAPAANATCASCFGIGIGNSVACTSGPTGIAIAMRDRAAAATATGPLTPESTAALGALSAATPPRWS